MAWDIPSIPVAGTIATVTGWATKIINCLRYLKGLDSQVPTIQSGLIIDNTDGDEYLKLPLISTAECSTVLNAEGEVAFDEQTHQMKEYDGTAVRVLISEADVDDTPVNGATTVPVSSNWAYDFQQALTTAGDLPYATGAGVWTRLGIGTALQLLRTNAGTTAPEWVTFEGISINTGTYSGDGADNKAVAHGLSVVPKLVVIMCTNAAGENLNGYSAGASGFVQLAGTYDATTAFTTTNFYIPEAGSVNLNQSAGGAKTYYWVALG